MNKSYHFLPLKILLFVICFVTFLSACSSPVQYNTVDIMSDPGAFGVEKPVYVNATKGTYKDCIYVSWTYTKLVTVNFDIYRSTSEDSEYSILCEDCENCTYTDMDAVPGVTYYYKIKAVSLLYGESEFSESAYGSRSGLPADDYEANELSEGTGKYLEVTSGTTYKRSIYPAGDTDYFKIKSNAGDFKKIEILSSGEKKSDFELFDAIFYDLTSDNQLKEIKTASKFEIGKSFTLITPANCEIYMDIKGYYATKTGDYNFVVTPLSKDGLLKGAVASSNYASYVKLSWTSESFISFYKVQRRVNETDEWKFISVSKSPFRKDTAASVTVNAAYDIDLSDDITYQYRICGYPNATMYCTSASTMGKLSKITTNAETYEPDNSFENAKLFTIPLSESRTISSSDDTDILKIVFEENKSYSITVAPSKTNTFSPDITLYDENGTLLIYIPPVEDTQAMIDKWLCRKTGTYYIKVTGINLKGEYTISIPQTAN